MLLETHAHTDKTHKATCYVRPNLGREESARNEENECECEDKCVKGPRGNPEHLVNSVKDNPRTVIYVDNCVECESACACALLLCCPMSW